MRGDRDFDRALRAREAPGVDPDGSKPGGLLVGDDVNIALDVQFVKQA